MRRSNWRLPAALLISLLAAACGDLPTENPAVETAQLGVSLDVSATTVASVSVQVTATDITSTLVYNIPVSDGTASGSIGVPPGSARTITVRAYDRFGGQTHEGSTTVDVRPGTNPPVTVTLLPRAGEVPITVDFASVYIQVSPTSYPNYSNGYSVGMMTGFQAAVLDHNGNLIPGAEVRWASLDPGVMGVSQTGTGYATAVGTTEIVATWNGYAGSYRVFVASGPDDGLPPQLYSLSFDRTSVRYTGTPQAVTLNISVADATSGIAYADAHVTSLSNGSSYVCHGRPTGTRGVWRCDVSIDSWMPLGEYVVSYVDVRDSANNGVTYTGPQLEQMGMAARFSVMP